MVKDIDSWRKTMSLNNSKKNESNRMPMHNVELVGGQKIPHECIAYKIPGHWIKLA